MQQLTVRFFILFMMQAAALGHLGRRTIIALIGAVAIIHLLPVTLYLPVLPDIAASLHSNLEAFQFTLPLYVMTQVVAMPLIALLADLGYRQQSLYWSLLLFILFSSVANIINSLLIFFHDGTPKILSLFALLIIMITWLAYLVTIPGNSK